MMQFAPNPFLAGTALLAVLLLPGCRRWQHSDDSGIQVAMRVEPQPPRVGPAQVTVVLTDAAGRPVGAAAVQLEGNMNHAGMVPVFADAREQAPGSYQATLELTMAGDWYVLVHATLADGRKIERTLGLRGVKPR